MLVTHTFPPVYNCHSKILILGTIPSPKSREYGFYYGHPQNRFWKILSAVFSQPIPETVSEKKDFLLKNQVALWDVLKSCDIQGAADSSIKKPVLNDFSEILYSCQIQNIYATGQTAGKLLQKHLNTFNNEISVTVLPSPSAANARYSLPRLINIYSVIKEN
jgi:G:T/U mismatch-specific DNA glycosylase